MSKNYYDFTELSQVYLEDSYVLDIAEAEGIISFTILLVLTEDHPRYHEPLPGEQYCYAHGVIDFAGVREVRWLSRDRQVYTDATGETDLGNIDTMTYEDGRYDLTGDWGQVRIFTHEQPHLRLD